MATLDETELPPLTEPVTVADIFVTGAAVESTQHVVRFVAWVDLPYLAGEATERRIVARFVMPRDGAGLFRESLTKHLTRKGDGK